MASWGETLARLVDVRLARPQTNAAAITALKAKDRFDGMLVVDKATGSLWVFAASSTAAAGPAVLSPDAGTGKWHAVGGGAAGGVGVAQVTTVVNATTGALGAYTRTGNTILADANGAVGAIDGVTNVVGDRLLLKDGAAGADNGLWQFDAVGGASAKFQLTRVGDADASAEISAGMLVYVSEGTANGNAWYFLSTDDPITLNTTSLSFLKVPNLTDLASTSAGLGASLVGIQDAGGIITGTTVEAALAENRTAIDAAEATIATHTSEIDLISPGLPMQNVLRMLGAPGAIVAGDTVTIGADVYEFNANTPPSGGTAGYIWVYQGADSATSRANFINAVNNVTDASNITYDGAVTEAMIASAGITTGDVVVQSAAAVGGAVAASATATACSETLTTGTDIWDNGTMQYGKLPAASQVAAITITVGAEELARGTMEAFFGFVPTSVCVKNRSRPADEAYVISGQCVSVTLAGGGSPNHQSGDVVDIIAFA